MHYHKVIKSPRLLCAKVFDRERRLITDRRAQTDKWTDWRMLPNILSPSFGVDNYFKGEVSELLNTTPRNFMH